MSTTKFPVAPTFRGPAEWFDGDVYVNAHYTGVAPSRARLNLVRFMPGAHTAWHRHAVGQVLHVTDGLGWVQSRGGELIELRPGDTVFTPAGEWHWHGASAQNAMCHLALWEAPLEEGVPETEWGAKLTDDEYPA
ncbi:MAG: cupin domain-containing protein [Microbacterium sp.]|jgi:quercetin dioxygenase-like cupin family protein|uniref:Cupin domain protein n=1 Tax=Microbacterium ginsengisoli TaxID=400772 RepID=A0A0F0LV72_9MICO|nr:MULTISPECIES: cupin domain-containing protein [Microbacterium]MAL06339.1 cupin domain-containing protein [Microbacterium sp.]MCK9919785.1 cupin domain-containing protein [Microbacteriaceae bacterium K1510]KJL36195.1 Cupin domain protein [Microbacterium ginsengisoli]KQR94036.1 cupin [Microbacterium sp. Leaf347]KQR97111.1 cupin [Microbacterium sp. Leaf351]